MTDTRSDSRETASVSWMQCVLIVLVVMSLCVILKSKPYGSDEISYFEGAHALRHGTLFDHLDEKDHRVFRLAMVVPYALPHALFGGSGIASNAFSGLLLGIAVLFCAGIAALLGGSRWAAMAIAGLVPIVLTYSGPMVEVVHLCTLSGGLYFLLRSAKSQAAPVKARVAPAGWQSAVGAGLFFGYAFCANAIVLRFAPAIALLAWWVWEHNRFRLLFLMSLAAMLPVFLEMLVWFSLGHSPLYGLTSSATAVQPGTVGADADMSAAQWGQSLLQTTRSTLLNYHLGLAWPLLLLACVVIPLPWIRRKARANLCGAPSSTGLTFDRALVVLAVAFVFHIALTVGLLAGFRGGAVPLRYAGALPVFVVLWVGTWTNVQVWEQRTWLRVTTVALLCVAIGFLVLKELGPLTSRHYTDVLPADLVSKGYWSRERVAKVITFSDGPSQWLGDPSDAGAKQPQPGDMLVIESRSEWVMQGNWHVPDMLVPGDPRWELVARYADLDIAGPLGPMRAALYARLGIERRALSLEIWRRTDIS